MHDSIKRRLVKTGQASFRLFILFAVLFSILCTFIPAPVSAEGHASPVQSIADSQIESLGIDEIKEYWEKVSDEYGGFLPESQKGSFMEFVKGEKNFDWKQWAAGFVRYMFHELFVHTKLLGTLILLTVFSMLLQTMQNAFNQPAVSKAAYGVIYLVLVILALNSFHVAMTYAQETIDEMMGFMIALLPLLLALMASVGSIAAAAFFHPVIVFLVSTSGLLVKNFVLPLLFLSTLLSIVSTMSEHHKVSQLASLLRKVAAGTLALFFTVFLTVMSVQGAATAVTDGVTLKAAKFVTGNFIPVVGRMFTDAADTVMSASVLLKNTVGIVGMAMLLIMAAFPAIKVLALAFIYSLAAAVLQPLGGGSIIECLSIIGKSVLYIFASLATVCIMFFLAVTLIVAAGNITLMVR